MGARSRQAEDTSIVQNPSCLFCRMNLAIAAGLLWLHGSAIAGAHSTSDQALVVESSPGEAVTCGIFLHNTLWYEIRSFQRRHLIEETVVALSARLPYFAVLPVYVSSMVLEFNDDLRINRHYFGVRLALA